MRPHGSISTSAIHFIISKIVSKVRADATEVPMPRTKSSSTNGLPATGRYKVHPNFENKNFPKKIFMLHYHQKNMLNPLVKSVFKSIAN